jgi:ribosomal protein S8E
MTLSPTVRDEADDNRAPLTRGALGCVRGTTVRPDGSRRRCGGKNDRRRREERNIALQRQSAFAQDRATWRNSYGWWANPQRKEVANARVRGRQASRTGEDSNARAANYDNTMREVTKKEMSRLCSWHLDGIQIVGRYPTNLNLAIE